MQPGERQIVEAHARRCVTCQQLLALALAESANSPANTQPGAEGALDEALPRGTLLGRYTVLELVGRGGMGDVYAAYDSQLNRRVALKLVRDRSDGEGGRGEARLLREARAIAGLSHQNVIVVHDAGSVDGRVFVAMEYVEGQTLSAWLRSKKRSLDEILTVFVEAAHGLAAAHAAGLVHRDFKPQNVMVGTEGTVRVTDFGLVRTLGEDLSSVAAGENVETCGPLSLTQTGELVGTPRYMSPEQFRRASTDARSDQFSYCVALYEALYGEHPFGAGGPLAELMRATREGRIRNSPERGSVPAHLRRTLIRGLSVNPIDRWPSMTDLAGALLDKPTRTRRRVALAVALGLSVLGAATLLGRASGSNGPAVCRGGLSRLAGIWVPGSGEIGTESRRAAIAAAFSQSGWPDFQQRWTRTAAVLDRFATDWLATYRDACEATQVRGEQSPEVLDARMACLDQRREALKALTDVLSNADRDVVASAIDAANALPDLSPCANLTLLRAFDPPPRSSADRARVDDLRRRAARAKALYDVGKHQQGIDLARGLLVEARQSGHPQLVPELLLTLGTFFVNGEARSEMEGTLEEAVWLALRAGRDDLAAEAAALLTGYVGYNEDRPDEGRRWAALAEALLDRIGGHSQRVRAWLLQERGDIEMETNVNEALRLFRESLALKREIFPADHPDIAFSLISEAEALHRLGRNEEANEVAHQAADILVSAYGSDSPHVAQAQSNRGEYLLALDRPQEALSLFKSALSVWQAARGPDFRYLAYPLTGIGRVMLDLGRPGDARAPLERALRIRQAREFRPIELGETSFALAQALWAGGERSRALALAESAQDEFARAPAAVKDRQAVASWVALHGRPRAATGAHRPTE